MKLALAALITLASASLATTAQAAQPVTGRWATVDGKAIVAIAPCGKQLCGRIERIVKPTPGRAPTDIKNPDPALRSKPLVGLALLSGFEDAGDAAFDYRAELGIPLRFNSFWHSRSTPMMLSTFAVRRLIVRLNSMPKP